MFYTCAVGQKTAPLLEVKRCKICGQRFTSDAAFCPFDGEPLALTGGPEPGGDPLLGTTVDGRYEVLQLLGEGGMGAVYLVRHKALGRMFALKALRREMARDRELCARFIQEARTAATINHPNVVQITDYGQLPDGIPYFVMEHLEGQPLSRLIRAGGPVPAARAVRIISQLAAGIGAAHRLGIVHRDLKPDNIFVLRGDNGDNLKILDFGVAKVAGSASMTRTGMVFGSPHYMSPEQASGQPVDHRADIYAVGVIMYELFTGRVPFEADTFMGVLTKHMFMAPERFRERVPEARDLGALEDVTLRCLEKKPDNRFGSMEALVAEIDQVVQLGAGDNDIDVRPSGAGQPRSVLSSLRLADELEPPSPYEINAARARRNAHDRTTKVAFVAMLVMAVLFLITLGAFAWSRLAPLPAELPAATASVAASGGPVPIPLPVSSSAPAAPVSSPPADPSSQPPATPVQSSSAPGPRPAKPKVANPAPPVTKSTGGGGDIVNPWQ